MARGSLVVALMTIADDLRSRTFAFAAHCVMFCRALPRDSDTRELSR